MCDNKGRLEELHAPLALLHSLQEVSCRFSSQPKLLLLPQAFTIAQHPDCLQAALQWQKQSSADKLEQAAKVGEMQSQLQQQAKCAQVGDLHSNSAPTAAGATATTQSEQHTMCLPPLQLLHHHHSNLCTLLCHAHRLGLPTVQPYCCMLTVVLVGMVMSAECRILACQEGVVWRSQRQRCCWLASEILEQSFAV